MYQASYFKAGNPGEIDDFIKANPFAIVIGFDGEYPVATQVPLLLNVENGTKKLTGHFKRKTDHHCVMAENPKVLVIFTGAHAYVSASVYEQPASASTWNYKTVQVKGRLRYLKEAETCRLLRNLTDEYEDTSSAAAFNKLGNEYVNKHIKAIQGFEIEIISIQHTFKLSQNHPLSNQRKIVADLEDRTDAAAHSLAIDMKNNLKDD